MYSILLREHKVPLRLSSVVYNSACRLYSDDKKKSKNTAPEVDSSQKSEQKKQISSEKLNLLLKAMIEDDSKPKIKLAQPSKKLRHKPKQSERDTETHVTENVNTDIITAAKDVADSLGGNIKQTESELLSKLLGNTSSGDSPNDQKLSLSEIIDGMQIDRNSKKSSEATYAQRIRQTLSRQAGYEKPSWTPRDKTKQLSRAERTAAVASSGRVDLFGAEPLGIFSPENMSGSDKSFLKTWDALHERELKMIIMHPPKNYFEKMILWTEQGKLWKFPINNEQGMDDEANVYFADHVFLEQHLESWCPTRGPVRHFMELVCVGLSKNYHISVKDKIDHIEWFKNYFENKKQLLKDVGAIAEDSKKPEISA